ncbi:GGDEF and EAL domain-containing protein [Thioalkalivibrio halophilus]|uniref:GGDEF domain-containing protein n=1 Tax=Thioalkalivibrio halophilus TaxID=252474 RepID=A0A1V3A1F1_9GAMM|nr:GGDEF and EAL domain-containing protein [Thioalkalivibrio halophilus]OOC11161.1 hypothetical protein B1A74_01865 [Thioalkalivibrio halophilus]
MTQEQQPQEEPALREALEQARERIRELEASREDARQTLEELQLHQEELRTQNEELRQTQQALAQASQRYQDLFDFAPVAFFVLDASGETLEVNRTATRMLGLPRSHLLQQPLRRFLDTGSREPFHQLLAAAGHGAPPDDFELVLNTPEQAELHVHASLSPDHDPEGLRFRLAMVDVTARKRAEQHQRLAATVFEESNEGIIVTDARARIQRVNRAFTIVTGYQEDEVVGRTPGLLSSGRHDRSFYEHMWNRLQEEGHWMGEVWNRRKNGEIYPEWLKINAVTDRDGNVRHYLGIFSDIGDHGQTGQDVERFAFYDALTGLPNRTLLHERLKHGLMRSKRDGKMVGVFYLDLDGFKTLNDTKGHQAGDLLLQQAAERLKQVVRPSDTVARLGGDEFTVVLCELEDEETAMQTARRVAGDILGALRRPFHIHGHEIISGGSIGIALFPRDGSTCSELAKHADIAMYQAKEDGGQKYAFFAPEMNHQLERRVSLENQLRHALGRNELSLAFQPVVDARQGRVAGVEALMRWDGFDGSISPLEFIPILENLGLGAEVARWTLEQACNALRDWTFPGAEELWLAVNFSPRQLHGLTAGDLHDTFAKTGVEPSRVVVEATEDHFRDDASSVISTLHDLRSLGVRVALDDFGTGHSSLGRLRHMPIDIIKLDRSFVRGLPEDTCDLAIVNTVMTMARHLDMHFLAEGVETCEQLGLLRDQGCDLIQGYVYIPPLPASDCARWCEEFHRDGPSSPSQCGDPT